MENHYPPENDPGAVPDLEAFRATEGTPPELQEVIEQLFPIGYIVSLIDETKLRHYFPCEFRRYFK